MPSDGVPDWPLSDTEATMESGYDKFERVWRKWLRRLRIAFVLLLYTALVLLIANVWWGNVDAGYDQLALYSALRALSPDAEIDLRSFPGKYFESILAPHPSIDVVHRKIGGQMQPLSRHEHGVQSEQYVFKFGPAECEMMITYDKDGRVTGYAIGRSLYRDISGMVPQ
jgi:hypothetical protein